jgi:hypothetical protein
MNLLMSLPMNPGMNPGHAGVRVGLIFSRRAA